MTARPYSVAFAPEAWTQISQMSLDTFKRFQAAVDSIAADVVTPLPSGKDTSTGLKVTAGGWVISYQRDEMNRRITVQGLHPAPPAR
jgi:mRNA-degrading endonuclease RelE of RelBE toxin-antitoxin system